MSGVEEWEGIARDLLERSGADDPPVDALVVADCWGFAVLQATGAIPSIDPVGRVIRVNLDQRAQRVQMDVAHELGHFGQQRAGVPDLEEGARYIGGAILLPRARFDRDLASTAWSITKLREMHSNVSATAIAVRITQLRDATCAIIDPRGRKAPWHIASPWLHDPRIERRRVTRWQRELASRAYAAGEEVHDDAAPLCYALPIIDVDGGEDRVLVVVEYRQLSLRL
jgi:hypothetical protein